MISCDQHDYIEIACTFRYPISLTMKSGKMMECVAIDTALNQNREECIKVSVKGIEELVALDEVSILTVLVDNPHFGTVTFG